jgi:putative ABC transport system permease protein
MQLRISPNLRGSHGFQVIGRLRPSATIAGARTELSQVAARIADQYPQFQQKRSVTLTPYEDILISDNVRKQLSVLFGAAVLVMLIACANAASLLLARASSRQREVAVAAALGASRSRVAQQFLVESLLLSTLGAIAGFALSKLAVRGIIVGAGTSLPRSTQVHFDWRVVLFVAGAILLTTFIFGLAPSLHAARANLQDVLRSGGSKGGSPGTARFRSALVVSQFALSLMLLAGAGLLLRTFAALLATPTGMVTENVLTLHIPLPLGSERYKTPDDALNRFYHPLLERVAALPGVKAVGMINLLPMQQYGSNGNFQILGMTYGSVADQPFAEYRVVSPGYFKTLGVPLVRGRDVELSDRAKTEQVVLINDALANKFFPGVDPVGRSIQSGPPSATNPPATIVGVVASVHQATLDADPLPELYVPTGQASGALGNMTLLVRTAADPTLIQKSVEIAIRSIDAAQPVFNVQTMDAVVRGSVADRRLYLGLLGTFAAVALLLAVAGIYGLISYSVSQRTREFGIRLALGSDTSSVQWLVVWEGIRLAFLGLAIGLPGAFLTNRLLASVLYGVRPHDPVTFGAVAVVLAGVSIISSYVPARRVGDVDPIIAIRAE